jgi:hypothetical protein
MALVDFVRRKARQTIVHARDLIPSFNGEKAWQLLSGQADS